MITFFHTFDRILAFIKIVDWPITSCALFEELQ
jgi:hypothetical protein